MGGCGSGCVNASIVRNDTPVSLRYTRGMAVVGRRQTTQGRPVSAAVRSIRVTMARAPGTSVEELAVKLGWTRAWTTKVLCILEAFGSLQRRRAIDRNGRIVWTIHPPADV